MQIDWEYWKGVFPLLAAAFGLLAAALGYLTARANRQAAAAARIAADKRKIQMLSLAPSRRRNWFRTFLVTVSILSIIFLTTALAMETTRSFADGNYPSALLAPVAAIGLLALAVNAAMLWLLLRKPDGSPSRTRAESAIAIKGSRNDVLEACLDAIRQCRFDILAYDAAAGVAECFFRGRALNEHTIRITVTSIDKGAHSVRIAVDATVHTALFDFGLNRRVAKRFLRALAKY